MSTRTLPPAPSLEFYRKEAKALLKAASAADPTAAARINIHRPNPEHRTFVLADALCVVAREHGFPSWTKFKAGIEGGLEAASHNGMASPETAETPPRSAPPQTDRAGAKKSGRDQSIGTAAVYAKTGRHWDEWFALLDAAGCATMTHKQIVAVAHANGVGSWWQQMVAVEYERARGLRDTNMNCDGEYNVAASRTIGAGMDAVFDAWTDPVRREQWLPAAQMTVRKAVPGKRVLITWEAGGSVTVNFYTKSPARTQCTAEHTKLASADDVERYRAYWSAALERLRAVLEA